MEETRVVIYDGYCKLCSRTVRWIKRNDRKGRYSFRPLQDNRDMDETIAYQPDKNTAPVGDTVLLLEGGRRYERSTAAIRIAMGLRYPWPILGILLIVPAFIRDAVYDLVARNRTRWFGVHTTCYLPED